MKALISSAVTVLASLLTAVGQWLVARHYWHRDAQHRRVLVQSEPYRGWVTTKEEVVYGKPYRVTFNGCPRERRELLAERWHDLSRIIAAPLLLGLMLLLAPLTDEDYISKICMVYGPVFGLLLLARPLAWLVTMPRMTWLTGWWRFKQLAGDCLLIACIVTILFGLCWSAGIVCNMPYAYYF